MKQLRAFTLIEMLVCISVGGVLMGVTLQLVHRTMRLESAARSRSQVERTTMRLSSQLRHDVHQAKTALLENENPGVALLQLRLPGQSPITYRLEGSSALREQQQPGGATARSSFAFPVNHSFKIDKRSAPARVVLTLQEEPQWIDVPPQVRLHVEAVVGQLLQPAPPGGTVP